MSDYLFNLAARTLNQTEVLRPRLLSLFEPPPKSGGPGSSVRSSQWVDAVAMSSETAPAVPVPPWPFPLAPAEPLPEPPSGTAPRLVRPAAVPAPPADPSATLGRQIRVPADQPATRPGPAAPGPDRQPSLPTSVAVPEPSAGKLSGTEARPWPGHVRPMAPPGIVPGDTGAAPPLSALERQWEPSLEPAVNHGVPGESAQPAEPRLPATPHLEPSGLEPTRRSTPAAVVVRPHVAPHVEPKAPSAAGALATPKSAPSIQVTIGRIEVKATSPQAPSPHTIRSAPPAMSLDDYLRRRTR